MKKLFIMALAAAIMCGCEKEIMNDEPTDNAVVITDDHGNVLPTKKFTFTLKGDFSDEWKPVTRGYLAADGKDLTDVWVLDYMDGELVQQLHQGDNTAENFGKPQMTLSYGSHHVYFVASRGAEPTLNNTNATITWSSVRDTFWKDYEVNVVSTSNGNRAVTLDRVVTKLVLSFTDAISANAKTIEFTPAAWYYGLNYQTGEPTTATVLQTNVMTIPDGYAGRDDVSLSYFSFSPSSEWSTDVTIQSKDQNGNVIGQGVLLDVPMKRNRQTEYSGPLFSAGGEMVLTLNDEWDTPVSGTW